MGKWTNSEKLYLIEQLAKLDDMKKIQLIKNILGII